MTQEIRIPDIGDAESVEVVEILVAPGDSVGPDDPEVGPPTQMAVLTRSEA